MSDPQLICVTGADGAGKTTQIVRLAERLERGAGKKVAVVTVWDLLLDPETQDLLAFEEPAQVDRYLSILSPTSRALFMFHCLLQALELGKRKGADVLLLNSYWYKYYATEVAHGGDVEVLRRLATVFPPPDRTFYLRLSPEAAAERKAVLSGYETGFAKPRSKEAFVAFQRPAHDALEALPEELDWTAVDANLDQKEQTELLLAAIDA